MTMKAKIFLVGENEETLAPMIKTEYESENILQSLLVKYPDLLPGDQISPENPRRWLLVSREMGVPGDTDEIGRWSLDHLFLDQDGIPTFVECKRSTDTRTRREVVAQMLDYAANGIEYWSMDRLRQAAAETARNRGSLLNDDVMKIIGTEYDEGVEIFWDSVEENLRQGKVRLIFAADKTPRELRRLVEFLNEKMADVEVLAVEIKQYLGEGQKAVVPRVIGLTEATRTSPGSQHTTRDEFISNCTPEAALLFDQVLDKALNERHKIYWGKLGFSTRLHLPTEDRFATFLLCFPPATFEFFFGPFPISDDEKDLLRKDLLNFGIFQEAGEKTLRASLEGDTLSNINEVIDFIFKKMDEIKEE